MKTLAGLAALVLSSALLMGAGADEGALKPLALRTEYLANPEGVETSQPRLQWP